MKEGEVELKPIARIIRGIYAVLDDLLLLAGLAFLVHGVSRIYPPTGNIMLGVGLVGLAYLVARRRDGR